MKKHVYFLFCLVISISIPLAAFAQSVDRDTSGSDASISYYLHMEKPNTHYFDVSIAVTGAGGDYVDFVMPAWAPGRYMIMDFARNVIRASAVDLAGKSLKTERIDKSTYRVYPGANGVVFRYSVYANCVSATFSSLSESGAIINGASLFMYVKNRETFPCSLSVYLPPNRGWSIVTPLYSGDEPNVFYADNYRHLIDCPVTAGEFARYAFECESVPFHVVFHEKKLKIDRSAIVGQIKRICEAAYDLFGEFPFKSYYFFFDFGYGPGEWDAIEHRNSMRFTDTVPYDTEYENSELLRIAAHELFHAWNVRAVMPAELVWCDLSKEVYCPSLWIVEGCASYYQYVLQLRAGILTRAQFRRKICDLVSIFEVSTGKELSSFRESAMLPWLDRPGIEDSDRMNTTISYYIRGTIVGLLLDMRLRALSGGKKSLDDVQRNLYNGFKQNSNGYTEAEYVRLCTDTGGEQVRDFIRKCVEEPGPLDYSAASQVGFVLEKYAGRILPFLGVRTEGKIVTWVIPDSPAETAGIEKYDEIYAIGSNPVFSDITNLIMRLRAGQRTSVSVLRDGQAFRFPVTLGSHTVYNFRFDEKPGGDSSIISIREAFYNGVSGN